VDIEYRAKRSNALLENEWFQETMKDLRETQMRTFANSSAQETEKREDAHAILRALTEIERSLQADVDALALIKRKGKHRGND
jgi:type IV secretory pathway VirB4 component